MPETESESKIIRSDNLEAFKVLLPQYKGKVKCINIDPLYHTLLNTVALTAYARGAKFPEACYNGVHFNSARSEAP